jgi:hypothetical protein
MEEVFKRDQAASQPVELARWEERPWWRRLKEWVVNLFGYWI